MDYIKNRNGKLIEIEGSLNSSRQAIASEFKRIRIEKGMTQQELADAAGMNRVDVSRFESGNYNPSIDLLTRCSAALNCELKFELIPRSHDNE